jgi:hypothetical protein
MSRKRYLRACACCGKHHKVARRDALACSSGCSAWLRRHPEHLRELREICRQQGVALFAVLRAKARWQAVTVSRPENLSARLPSRSLMQSPTTNTNFSLLALTLVALLAGCPVF